MLNKTPFGRLGLFLAFSLSLGACSGVTSEIGDGDSIVITDDAVSDTTRAPIPPREVSPFDEFRNILWSLELDEESQRRQFDADRVREEDMIAQCMNELGFEYLPFVENITLNFSGNWEPDNPEWVATFGYGWVDSPPGGRGRGSIFMDVDNPNSPNAPMLADLSETERSAWQNAFTNQGAGFEREVDGVIQRDCNNWARAVVAAEHQALANQVEFAPLMESISQMHNSLRWDVTDADRAWSTCMFDAGFAGFDRQWEPSEAIMQEWAAASNAISSHPDWTSGAPTIRNSPELVTLQEREVALATADLNCRVSTNFAEGHRAAVHTVENQFITDHRVELEALREAAEQHS